MRGDAVRPRRSALYLPASNVRAIEKARGLDCDVVILDLEDAVAPQMKTMARERALAAVAQGGFGARELVVRVNGLDTDWGADDLAALASLQGRAPDAVLIPKARGSEDVLAARRRLEGSAVPLWTMIETAVSLFRLETIAATAHDQGLTGLVMGLNDLAAETGARPDAGREPFLGALGLAVAAARAHGLVILDGVFNDLEDEAGFEAQTRQGVAFGFDGKTLIHPRQIATCNRLFTPDTAAVAWARAVVAAFDAPENADRGAVRLEGRMIERLHLRQARRTLAATGADV